MALHKKLVGLSPLLLATIALVTILLGCGGHHDAPPPHAITIQPSSAALHPNGSQQFQATVADSPAAVVTWSIKEGAGCGTVDNQGNYLSPTVIPTDACHVLASASNATTTSATVTITPGPKVVVSPDKITLTGGESQTFAATVTGSANTSVTWSVLEGSVAGSITSSGVYTAPTTPGTYHVIATSQADSTVMGNAVVTVKAGSIGVVVQ